MELLELHYRAQSLSIDSWVKAWIDHAEGIDVGFAMPDFPSEEIQKITNNASGAVTMRGAGWFYRILDQEIPREFLNVDDLRILDYGGGWGRITRLLLRSFKPGNISSVDVDERLVSAGQEALPCIDFKRIESGGRLPYEDQTFDVVIANSVFSHLSEDLQMKSLGELARICRPNARLFLTTLSNLHLDNWLKNEEQARWIERVVGNPSSVKSLLNSGEFVFGPTGRWPEYGIALLPADWAMKNWPKIGLRLLRQRDDYSQIINIAAPVDSSLPVNNDINL